MVSGGSINIIILLYRYAFRYICFKIIRNNPKYAYGVSFTGFGDLQIIILFLFSGTHHPFGGREI